MASFSTRFKWRNSLDLIKNSDSIELQKLGEDVIVMLGYARTGETRELKKLFSRGLSPVMVDGDGRSALNEAIISGKIDEVDCLMEIKAKEQIMLWTRNRVEPELPIHTAARFGFVEALERILKHYPDVLDIHRDGNGTALYYAASYGHSDAVRLLLKNGAKVLPPKVPVCMTTETPPHCTGVGDIMKLLLEAPGGLECMEFKDGWARLLYCQQHISEMADVLKFYSSMEHQSTLCGRVGT